MDQLLVTLAAGVMTTLSGVIVFLYKELSKERAARLSDAKEVNKKITSPIADVTDMTEKIYAALHDKKRGK